MKTEPAQPNSNTTALTTKPFFFFFLTMYGIIVLTPQGLGL